MLKRKRDDKEDDGEEEEPKRAKRKTGEIEGVCRDIITKRGAQVLKVITNERISVLSTFFIRCANKHEFKKSAGCILHQKNADKNFCKKCGDISQRTIMKQNWDKNEKMFTIAFIPEELKKKQWSKMQQYGKEDDTKEKIDGHHCLLWTKGRQKDRNGQREMYGHCTFFGP